MDSGLFWREKIVSLALASRKHNVLIWRINTSLFQNRDCALELLLLWDCCWDCHRFSSTILCAQVESPQKVSSTHKKFESLHAKRGHAEIQTHNDDASTKEMSSHEPNSTSMLVVPGHDENVLWLFTTATFIHSRPFWPSTNSIAASPFSHGGRRWHDCLLSQERTLSTCCTPYSQEEADRG